MFSDRVFQIAFLLSLITHGVILFQHSNFVTLSRNQKEQKLEVSYLKNPPETKEEPRNFIPKREPFLKLPARITLDKRTPPPFVDRESIFKRNREINPSNYAFNKPALIKPDIIAIKKKITLPPIEMDKINNPSYISYYQTVREKIKRAAYQNYTRTETGEVYATFIISDDGYLKDIKIVDEKSSPNQYLKNIALRSLKDASPFPNFPKELDYPNLTFNVVISFEIE